MPVEFHFGSQAFKPGRYEGRIGDGVEIAVRTLGLAEGHMNVKTRRLFSRSCDNSILLHLGMFLQR